MNSIIDFLKKLPNCPKYDQDSDYMNSENYYPILNNLMVDMKPKSVLEIGVRYGYSGISFIHGNGIKKYVGIDYERYDSDSINKAKINFDYLKTIDDFEYELIFKNTQELTDLNFLNGQTFDIIHVDGDHSFEGCTCDIFNFWNVLNIWGYMLIDDSIFYGSVKDSIKTALKTLDEPNYNVESFRGTWVIKKTKDARFDITQSKRNEIKTYLNEEVYFKFFAKHIGWSGDLILLKDKKFLGGYTSPNGKWEIFDEKIVLNWNHWPKTILEKKDINTFKSIDSNDPLVLTSVNEFIFNKE